MELEWAEGVMEQCGPGTALVDHTGGFVSRMVLQCFLQLAAMTRPLYSLMDQP